MGPGRPRHKASHKQSAGEKVETAALPAAVWVAVDVCCACQCGLNKEAGQELSL